MNNKSIKKKYEQMLNKLQKNNTEENKNEYLIIFKELDNTLNSELSNSYEDLSYPANTLTLEVDRIKEIVAIFKYRLTWRSKMLSDFERLMGYKITDLNPIPYIEEVQNYEEYKKNLVQGKAFVQELMKITEKMDAIKTQNAKKGKTGIDKELIKLQDERDDKLAALRERKEILNDLYDYSITAPFNQENAYIQYLLIKANPNSTLKIDLGCTPNRTLKQKENKLQKKKPFERMPAVLNLGSVKPNNMLTHMEEAEKEFNDINLPNNGLTGTKSSINIEKDNIMN